MCRLFGFRSVINSGVHRSLVKAENALLHQSTNHPDGWGIAYYIDNAPHVMKSSSTAVQDDLFKKLTGIVSSQTVLAHVRKATSGKNSVTNTHPFQYGFWVFAHNGNIKDLDKHRDKLLKSVNTNLARFLLGDTDSEIIFFLLLTNVLASPAKEYSPEHLVKAVQKTIATVESICGPISKDNRNDPQQTYLSFILTNGHAMVAHQGGQSLHYSTYKKKCPESATCPKYAPECEKPSENHVNHLLLSSEPLEGENIWIELKPYEIIGVDAQMNLFRGQSQNQK